MSYLLQEVDAKIAWNEGKVDLHAFVKMPILNHETNKKELTETTVGRILFNEIVPEGVPYINYLLTKRNLKTVISNIIKATDVPRTAGILR